MPGPKYFTTDDPWLADLDKKAQALRQAFVLRQYDHVGFTGYSLLHEFIEKSRTDVSVDDCNAVTDDYTKPVISDPTSVDVYDSLPVNQFDLFPHRGPAGKHLNHRAFPLQDNHPAIVCVGYVVAAIQNLGYIPSAAKPMPEFTTAHKAKLAPLNQSQLQAHTTYHICSFLIEVYGTWINISPSILLQCMQYFLPVSPLSAYLICAHLLNAVPANVQEPTDKERLLQYSQGKKWKTPVVIKNLRYRRQLYVYLIQSITIAVRLRFHTLYAPDAFPFAVIEASGVELSPAERFKRSFVEIFVDLAQRQAELILDRMNEFTLTEDNLYHNANEKASTYPYIPVHIQQHVGSIFAAIDHQQSQFEFSSYEPYQIMRVFITGTVTLNPSERASVTSIVLQTRPLPPQDQIDPTDPHYNYIAQKYQEQGINLNKNTKALTHTDLDSDNDDDDDVDVDYFGNVQSSQSQAKLILDALERITNQSVENNVELDLGDHADPRHPHGGDIDPSTYASELLTHFGSEQQQAHTDSSNTQPRQSPIVTTTLEAKENAASGALQQQASSNGIFYPIAAVAVGLLARHGCFTIFWQQILRIPGVRRVIKMLRGVLKVLYGK